MVLVISHRNFDFLITICIQLNVVDLRYFKLLDQIFPKFKISKVNTIDYTIRFQRSSLCVLKIWIFWLLYKKPSFLFKFVQISHLCIIDFVKKLYFIFWIFPLKVKTQNTVNKLFRIFYYAKFLSNVTSLWNIRKRFTKLFEWLCVIVAPSVLNLFSSMRKADFFLLQYLS